MSVEIETEVDTCKIAIDGEMTIFEASEIYQKILGSIRNSKDIEIDLSEVSEIDTAGLQLIMVAKILNAANGGRLSLINHSKAVQDILELTNLGGFFGDPIILSADAG